MKLIPCPHCGREVSRSVLRKHIDACPANPATRPHTAALLADPDNPGYIRQYNDYQRVQHNSPAASTLMLMTMYGSWPGVAAAFGLLNDEAIKLETCPHCGRQIHAGRIWMHEPRCPARPDVYAATHAVLIDPDNPDRARSQNEYRRMSPGTEAASPSNLIEHYGSWHAVVLAHGLISLARRHHGDRAKVASLNAPLSDDERHACARRGRLERE